MPKDSLRPGILLVVFLLLFSYAYSEPKIEISETVWDFGYIPKDEVVTHAFVIRNSGEDSLFVNNIRTSCCCSHAPILRSRLGANEEVEIEVSFNSRRFNGDVQKTVYINSNDTIARFSSIFIGAKVGTLNELVKLIPEKICFKKDEETKTIWIRNISDSFVQISVAAPPKPIVDFKIDNMNLNPFDSTQVSFTKREVKSSKPFKTSLTLDFLGTKKVRCTIPIRTIGDR